MTIAGVVNSMAKTEQDLLAIELCGDFSKKAASGVTGASRDPMHDSLEWGLSDSVFMCAVIAPPQRTLRKSERNVWPQTTVTLSAAIDRRTSLQESGMSGFELVIGTSTDCDSAIQVFGKLGYQEAGRSICGSGDKHDPLAAAWNKVDLSNAVQIAARLSSGVLCIFAHDADPVYLLTRKE